MLQVDLSIGKILWVPVLPEIHAGRLLEEPLYKSRSRPSWRASNLTGWFHIWDMRCTSPSILYARVLSGINAICRVSTGGSATRVLRALGYPYHGVLGLLTRAVQKPSY